MEPRQPAADAWIYPKTTPSRGTWRTKRHRRQSETPDMVFIKDPSSKPGATDRQSRWRRLEADPWIGPPGWADEVGQEGEAWRRPIATPPRGTWRINAIVARPEHRTWFSSGKLLYALKLGPEIRQTREDEQGGDGPRSPRSRMNRAALLKIGAQPKCFSKNPPKSVWWSSSHLQQAEWIGRHHLHIEISSVQ